MDRSGVASTSGRSQRNGSKSSEFGHSRTNFPIGELSEQEFHARCYILDLISIQLLDKKVSSTDGLPQNMVYFTKEQFAEGLWLPIPSLVKQFFNFSKISPIFIHPNVILILMECSILDALYQLDLSLLEVLFVYTNKMSPKERFILSTHISSLQFTIGLPNCSKG